MFLRHQYDRAVHEGWLSFFYAAAARYDVDPAVLLAIASRETEMGGPVLADGSFKWLVMPGDGGHGFGLMQVDKRHYPTWIDTGAWHHAEAGIHMGASVLAAKRQGLVARAGQRVTVKDRTTARPYTFTMPTLDGPTLERVAIASYNTGDWAPYHYVRRGDPDYGTTGKNYSLDVLGRAELFRRWLEDDHDARPTESQRRRRG